jgi:hypothetical protein
LPGNYLTSCALTLRHATVGLVGPRFEFGIRDRRRFKDKAAVLLRTVRAINQHTPIEWSRDLSRPMIRWLLELGLKGEKK